jgi:DNA-binding GntR family transcriptional regulator
MCDRLLETLLTIIEHLWLQISPYFNLLRGSSNYEDSNKHHQVMVEGLRARNEKQVSDAVRADIDAAYQVLLELV